MKKKLLASIQESSEEGTTIEAKAKVCKQGSDWEYEFGQFQNLQ